jgi:hypothetical protein
VSGVFGRLTKLFESPWARKRHVVTTDSFCLEAAEACGRRLVKGTDESAVLALAQYNKRLLQTDSVEAAAFLVTRGSMGPATLIVDVFAPLRRDDEASAGIVDAVGTATAELMAHLDPVIPSALQYVSTARKDLDVLERELRSGWAEDPSLEILAFLEFQRHAAARGTPQP